MDLLFWVILLVGIPWLLATASCYLICLRRVAHKPSLRRCAGTTISCLLAEVGVIAVFIQFTAYWYSGLVMWLLVLGIAWPIALGLATIITRHILPVGTKLTILLAILCLASFYVVGALVNLTGFGIPD